MFLPACTWPGGGGAQGEGADGLRNFECGPPPRIENYKG